MTLVDEIIDKAMGEKPEIKPAKRKLAAGASINDFYAYLPQHSYIYVPTREMWPAASINAHLEPIEGIKPSLWLDQNRAIHQMTWAPLPHMLIRGRLVLDGWVETADNVTCFNLYRAPALKLGIAANAKPWIDHVRKLYGDDADHLIKWMAHRVQRPQDKINHAIVLGGLQGIGKDTLLEPVKRAIGPWNFCEVSPQQMMGRFNGFVKSVILRVSEARDLGDVDRYGFYEHLKAYTASPPDVLRVDEKHLREYNVFNVCGVVITTNHKTSGIYLPADDRRHFVAWSNLAKEDFTEAYWSGLWNWYGKGGDGDVAAYLAKINISDFNPKAPPPKTAAFWDIVDANRSPEDAELADVLDRLGNPEAITLLRVATEATGDFQVWMRERKNRRIIPHRFEQCGYIPVRNDAAKDGLWKINGERQAVYARNNLSLRDRFAAVGKLTQ
jgi:hypothetical protein